MTEQEWLTCDDIAPLLAYIADRASMRKRRLYLCGGCRHISHLFYNSASEKVVEVAEQFSDGLATADELSCAAYFAEEPTFGYDLDGESRRIYGEPTESIRRLVAMGALPASVLARGDDVVAPDARGRLISAAWLAYRAAYTSAPIDQYFIEYAAAGGWPCADLVRCVFGNPFRTPPMSPACYSLTVTHLATTIYTDRLFDRLPILADALEEAGCTDTDMLEHCRKPGLHVRGCWVVDLILGKE